MNEPVRKTPLLEHPEFDKKAAQYITVHLLGLISKGLAKNKKEGKQPDVIERLAAAINVDESNLKRIKNARSYRVLRLACALDLPTSDFYPERELWLEKIRSALDV